MMPTPDHVVDRGNAEGAGFPPPYVAASRGGPTKTAEPATRGAGFGVTAFPAYMARGCAFAHIANAARAIHADRENAASRPSWASGAIGMPSADAAHPGKDV